jgi:hypothetical protein
VNTYRRVLGQALDSEEFEQVVREFFAAQICSLVNNLDLRPML